MMHAHDGVTFHAPEGDIEKCLNKDRQILMSLVLLFHYLLLKMFRMLVHPSSALLQPA